MRVDTPKELRSFSLTGHLTSLMTLTPRAQRLRTSTRTKSSEHAGIKLDSSHLQQSANLHSGHSRGDHLVINVLQLQKWPSIPCRNSGDLLFILWNTS